MQTKAQTRFLFYERKKMNISAKEIFGGEIQYFRLDPQY